MLLRPLRSAACRRGVAEIKASVEKAYGKRGRTMVERNFAAIDAALANLAEVDDPRGSCLPVAR